MSRLVVRKVGVLGAGVMGAQIAAHCANAGCDVVLFDLPGAAAAALERLPSLSPPALATARERLRITPASYDTDLARLRECELVIEAIAERLELKAALFERVAPFIHEEALLATNTSGLSVRALSDVLPSPLRARFCGVHFFNPPRYMALVELITGPETEPVLLDRLESWLTTRLGKSVVRAHDTPNFIANRIGMFALLAVMRHTERLGLHFDEADALTGPLIGRPRSATFRTADVVGLDTMAHVIGTLRDRLPDDPWHPWFGEPQWLSRLVERGALGAKSGAGVYRKDGKRIQVLDGEAYRDSRAEVAPEVAAILAERDPALRLQRLRASSHPQAEMLWSSLRDLFHYAAFHLSEVAESAREVDLAMRWGFGWAQGPFELWQSAGWRAVAQAIQADIDAGLTMADVPLPEWVFERDAVHETDGSWSVASGGLQSRIALQVYLRQLTPERVFGEDGAAPGEELWHNAGVRLWRRSDQDPRIGIVSLTTRMHVIDDAVLEGLLEVVQRAGRDLNGLVIHQAAPFSAGADLKRVLSGCEAGNFAALERMIHGFQRVAQAIQGSVVPVVAAIEGQALGGGCEFAMRAAHRVLAFESRVGLVESAVGLIPAGGGSAALAVEAARLARRAGGEDVLPFVQQMFLHIMGGVVSDNARHAQNLGYARRSDDVVMHPREVLYVAIQRARVLHDVAWAPVPLERDVVVAGREGAAACVAALAARRELGRHELRVAQATAAALCGGDVAAGAHADEADLLELERAQCMALLRTPETQARIRHMLETGRPLPN